MSNNGEAKQQQAQPEPPEFKGEYFWAFAALMLYKLGGWQSIPLEMLEKFDFKNSCPQVTWDAKKQVFIMRNPEIKKPPEKSLINLPGKIRKKMLKNIIHNHFG